MQQMIEQVLTQFTDPILGVPLEKTGIVISTQGNGQLGIQLKVGFPAQQFQHVLIKHIRQSLQTAGIAESEITITVNWQIRAHAIAQNRALHPRIKNIIAVTSAKGGVGKSTTAANLALALAAEGAAVGILDADIYGPNQPLLLGAGNDKAEQRDKKLIPLNYYGLQTMSMGYLVGDQTAMVWRGPMVSTALQQLLRDTQWDALDYLILDMPPGTGDIALTTAQKLPIAGAVAITTPQDLAVSDSQRGLEMFRNLQIPLLGVIENMSVYHCAHCGHAAALFGEGGGAKLAAANDLPLLGQLPLDVRIRQDSETGKPIVVRKPESDLATEYRHIALRLAARLAAQPVHVAAKFPPIVVEK